MFRSLQACRAFAALSVVLMHTSEGIFVRSKYFGYKPYGVFFEFGQTGVLIFFVLSGFVMWHAHSKDFGQPRRIGIYFWKRFSRIYPPYWVALTMVAIVFLLAPSFGMGHERQASSLIFSYLLIPTPEPENVLVLGVAWTLVYEVFFYVMFSLFVLSRRVGGFLFVCWAVGVLCYARFVEFPGSFIFSQFHLYFLTGVVTAIAVSRVQLSFPRLTAVLGAAIYFATSYTELYFPVLSNNQRITGICVSCALVVLGMVQAEQRGLIHIPRFIEFVGNASYSIYLIHFPILSATAKLVKWSGIDQWMPLAILFWIFVGISMLGGCVFHLAIELPILRLLGRRPARNALTNVRRPENVQQRHGANQVLKGSTA